MRRWMLIAAALVVAGCGTDAPQGLAAKRVTEATTVTAPTTTLSTTTSSTTTVGVAVNWANYAAGLQARIDGLDCAALQREFNNADANNAAQRARTGESNVKLMEYIEAKRRASRC